MKQKLIVSKENNVLSTISDMNELVELVRSYNDYVRDFKAKNKDVYDYFNQKFLKNDQMVEDIFKDLEKVSITDESGALELSFVKNGKRIYFYVDSLIEDDLSKEITRLEAKLKKELNDLKLVENIISDLKTERAGIKLSKPKKILGIFVSPYEKEKCEKLYKRELRRIDAKIADELISKNMIESEIRCTENEISDLKSTVEFINSLTQEEKDLIISKYNEVKKIFDVDQNDIKMYKKFESQIKTLPEYLSETRNIDAKKELFPLIKYLYNLYRDLRDEEEYIDISELSTMYDFKQFKCEVDSLTYAMSDYQFGKITPSRLDSYEKSLKKQKLFRKDEDEDFKENEQD